MSRKEALDSFQSITGADEATAKCFLDSANWKVDVALSTFFDSGGVLPATNPTPTSVPKEESDYKKLEDDYKRLQEKLRFYENEERTASSSTAPTYTLTATEENDLRSAFNSIDKKKSGKIDHKELQDLAFLLRYTLSEEQAQQAFKTFDTDSDGFISFADCTKWWASTKSKSSSAHGSTSISDRLRSKDKMGPSSFLKKLKKLSTVAKQGHENLFREEVSLASASSSSSSSSPQGSNVRLNLGAKIGSFEESKAQVSVLFNKDETAAAEARKDYKAPSDDVLILSIGFFVKEDVETFGLGELSGTIKDILATIKDTLKFSKFQVQVKQEGEGRLFRVTLFFDRGVLPLEDTLQSFIEALGPQEFQLDVDLSSSPNDAADSTSSSSSSSTDGDGGDIDFSSKTSENVSGGGVVDEELMKFRVGLKAECSRASFNTIAETLWSEGGYGSKLKLISRMKNLDFNVEFNDIDDLWDELLGLGDEEEEEEGEGEGQQLSVFGALKKGDLSFSWKKLRNWNSIRPLVSPLLAETFEEAPPPVSAMYFNALEKLEGLGVLFVQHRHYSITIRFKNFGFSCLPNRNQLSQFIKEQQRKKQLKQKADQLYKNAAFKCVLVGDPGVGKTSFAITALTHQFPVDYIPTVADNADITLFVDGRPVSFGLWDTAGQEEYSRLRVLSYPYTDIFFLCYAVNDPRSLLNIQTQWAQEVQERGTGATLVLLGLKSDLRKQAGEDNIVTHEEVQRVRSSVGARACVECSARELTGLAQVFIEAIRARHRALESALI